MLFLTFISLSTLGSLGMCRGKKKYTLFAQLVLCNLFCSSSTDWGMSMPIQKKDILIFGSPHYLVKASYRFYVLTVCLIDTQVCEE